MNLVDIDLLVGGERFTFRQPLPPGHFYAFVIRADRRPRMAEAYAWSDRDAMPRIPIPLRAPDPDVIIDLGAAYQLAFDRGGYRRRLRYDRPVLSGLDDPAAQWSSAGVAGQDQGAR